MTGTSPLAQACAVPYRIREDTVEFCLITSIRGRRWGFPKGIVDPGETAIESALKEAWEEAGLRGHIVGEPLGTYRYEKWSQTLEVTVHVMHVTAVADSWQESHLRERLWADAIETRRLLADDPRGEFFERALTIARDSIADRN